MLYISHRTKSSESKHWSMSKTSLHLSSPSLWQTSQARPPTATKHETRNTTMALQQLPQTYKAIHLANRPKDAIEPTTFETKTHPTPSPSSLKDGQVLYQPQYLSLDPAMRAWLNDVRSYIPPVQIGAVMRGVGVGTIIASKSKDFQPGDVVYAPSGWREIAVINAKEVEKISPLPPKARMTDYIGVLGMPGLTAYFGILDVGKVKAGDFVVVSGAAGATGTVVGQIAKLKGARVLGIAGSEEKCKWLVEDLGFDAALNYKEEGFALKFRRATKDLIDVFFDNVGGEVLDLALGRAKEHARFVMVRLINQTSSRICFADGRFSAAAFRNTTSKTPRAPRTTS